MAEEQDVEAGLTEAERHVIEHSLGISQTGKEYRNSFVAAPGHTDWPTLAGLVTRGLMTKRKYPLAKDDFVFHVTEAGRAMIAAAAERGGGG